MTTIVAVTPNPAIDRTYRVEHLSLGDSHRVKAVHSQAGGKGINVARILTSFEFPVIATAIVGGTNGDWIRNELSIAGVASQLVTSGSDSRQTITAATTGGEDWIEFDEGGNGVSTDIWRDFRDLVSSLMESADVVVLSGSLPPGVPIDGYRELVEIAHHAQVRVVLDTSGLPLREALGAHPDVIKPNRSELAAISEIACDSVENVLAACRRLRVLGAEAIVVTLGAEGSVVFVDESVWRVRHPPRSGNPVGAGDAMTAGIAAGLFEKLELINAVRRGATWALASMASPFAGLIEVPRVAECAALIEVESLDPLGDCGR
jgi:tagatose 6-phosphate kinase